jgi:AP-2 complex subunit alpha
MTPASSTYLLKKSSLALLHLYKKNPDVVTPASWVDRIRTLLQNSDGGVLTAVLSLLITFAAPNPSLFEEIVPVVCKLLNNTVMNKAITGDYMYDHIPAPWLLVKGFQFLQFFTQLPSEESQKDLEVVLRRIINTDSKNFAGVDKVAKQVKKHNAMLAVLFEGVNLVVKLSVSQSLVQKCVVHVRYFMTLPDPDIRYLSLEAAQRLCPLDPTTTGDDPAFVTIVEKTLKHNDISLRRRSLDVLFEMCNKKNSAVIVNRVVDYLDVAEYELKEELV